MSTVKTHARHTLSVLRESLADISYAQRRMMEIRLGLPPEELRRRAPAHTRADELEALFRSSPDS